jgi:hypothetical protein
LREVSVSLPPFLLSAVKCEGAAFLPRVVTHTRDQRRDNPLRHQKRSSSPFFRLSPTNLLQLVILPSVPHEPPQTARHPAGPSRRGGRGRGGGVSGLGSWWAASLTEPVVRVLLLLLRHDSVDRRLSSRPGPVSEFRRIASFLPARSPCLHVMTRYLLVCPVPDEASR